GFFFFFFFSSRRRHTRSKRDWSSDVCSSDLKELLLKGLERLEYRGYDSAGISLHEPGGLERQRAVGQLDRLKTLVGPNGSHATRSEERRVGKEGRHREVVEPEKKKERRTYMS